MTDPRAAMSLGGGEEQAGASAKPGSQVRVTWQHRWSTKSLSKYTATVSPGKGLVFVTCEDYATACAFAERLAIFLRFPLENRVPEANRKQGVNRRLASADFWPNRPFPTQRPFLTCGLFICISNHFGQARGSAPPGSL